MPDSGELLDEDAAVERLNKALELQLRSALQYSLTASTVVGFEGHALADALTRYGDDELADARRLIAKVVALGGTPTTQVAELRVDRELKAAVEWLVQCERDAVEALQQAIEPTGREGQSEALEHLLEHLILRKHEQIDRLQRGLATP